MFRRWPRMPRQVLPARACGLFVTALTACSLFVRFPGHDTQDWSVSAARARTAPVMAVQQDFAGTCREITRLSLTVQWDEIREEIGRHDEAR